MNLEILFFESNQTTTQKRDDSNCKTKQNKLKWVNWPDWPQEQEQYFQIKMIKVFGWDHKSQIIKLNSDF